jgi:hypothetical protein
MPEIHTRSKKNVKEHGEVFTPFAIVDKMVELVPKEAWTDPEYCFLEPACGNGQILVKIFEKRIDSGVSIEDALNTMIGMDISQENIEESYSRLCERACAQMRVEGIVPRSREWNFRAVKIVAIITNNIFKVEDSIRYIQSGELAKKSFFFSDPTGSGQIMSTDKKQKRIACIKKQFQRFQQSYKVNPQKYQNRILVHFFSKAE